jgi:hypothetical protein
MASINPHRFRLFPRTGTSTPGKRFRTMFDLMWNDDECEFTRVEINIVGAEAHAKPSAHDKEQLVFRIMVMPIELTGKHGQLYKRVVHFAGHLTTPVRFQWTSGSRGLLVVTSESSNCDPARATNHHQAGTPLSPVGSHRLQ